MIRFFLGLLFFPEQSLAVLPKGMDVRVIIRDLRVLDIDLRVFLPAGSIHLTID